MIVIDHSVVYGIDVYRFDSSRGIPYQLTFEQNINGNYTDVCLVNLLGSNDSPYCKEVRAAVSQAAKKHLKRKETLFFNIEYSDKRSLLLLLKFLRWISLDRTVKITTEITQTGDIDYIEVYLSL